MVAFFERRERQFDMFHSTRMTFYSHIHSHTELVFVFDGEIEMIIDGTTKTLHKGEMAAIFPNTAHSYRSENKNAVTVVIFHGDLVPEYAHRLTHERPASAFLSAAAIHSDVYSALENLKDSALSTPLRKAYLAVMIGRILENLPTEKRSKAQKEDLLYKLLTYLEENYRQPLSLETLAAALKVSRYRISRCFSSQIGCTFNEYVNGLRIGFAADLLRNTSLSASQAGFEAGFDSLSTFYRAFKERYGTSPRAYKKG